MKKNAFFIISIFSYEEKIDNLSVCDIYTNYLYKNTIL